MRNLYAAGKLLLSDLASTLLFLVVFLISKSIPLAVTLGVALGITQIGLQFARRKSVETMEWLSLFLVVGAGTATLLTNDPRFVLFKPSLIYTVVGIVMLKPGWMKRYLSADAVALLPDIAIIFGFVWAALMFVSAALNIVAALNFSVVAWSLFMSVYAILSKATLFLIQYGTMHYIALRRRQTR